MSLVVKIEPSPDWFVGIDSLSLCQHGHWLENHDIDLWPLDCGTQRGKLTSINLTDEMWLTAREESFYVFQVTHFHLLAGVVTLWSQYQ